MLSTLASGLNLRYRPLEDLAFSRLMKNVIQGLGRAGLKAPPFRSAPQHFFISLLDWNSCNWT